MSASLKLTPASPDACLLQVMPQEAPGQFNIENADLGKLGSDFDREYVSFGGFFGPHDPHVFAAAPDLKLALELALRHWFANAPENPPHRQPVWVQKARKALASARGEA